MITELELALCDNRNLDDVARQLTERANAEKQERIRQINRDLALARLIREGLNEPLGSAPHNICKCYIRYFKKKNGVTNDLARELLKEARENAPDVIDDIDDIDNLDDIDVIDNPDDIEGSDDHDGTGEAGTECTGVQTPVSTGIPAEEQGEG